jgi:hypothetical protein
MTERDEVLAVLKREVMSVKDRFGVRRMGLFGSVVRDEAGDQSDIDILIELDPESVSYRKISILKSISSHYFQGRWRVSRSMGYQKYILPYISREVVWV